MSWLKRGELAKTTGTNIETIRYYENTGIIPEAKRNEKGYRLFPEETVKAVHFIKNCQNLGFTLKEISLLRELKIEANQQCGHVKETVDAKIADLNRKIKDLTAIRKALKAMSRLCVPETSGRSCHFMELLEEETQ